MHTKSLSALGFGRPSGWIIAWVGRCTFSAGATGRPRSSPPPPPRRGGAAPGAGEPQLSASPRLRSLDLQIAGRPRCSRDAARQARFGPALRRAALARTRGNGSVAAQRGGGAAAPPHCAAHHRRGARWRGKRAWANGGHTSAAFLRAWPFAGGLPLLHNNAEGVRCPRQAHDPLNPVRRPPPAAQQELSRECKVLKAPCTAANTAHGRLNNT